MAVLGQDLNDDEVTVADPELTRSTGLWKLDMESPAVNAAGTTYDFIVDDIDGQLRDVPDVGADEYSTEEIIRLPLTADMVGPDSDEITSAEPMVRTFVPMLFDLKQNYPNPFNPTTTIQYSVAANLLKGPNQKVNLSIYNAIGQKIITLVSEQQPAGEYQARWDASGLSTGIYYYKLTIGNGYRTMFRQTKKMLFIQ